MLSPPPPIAAAEPNELLDRLVRSFDQLTVGRTAATQVLAVIDDPNADARRIASVVETDAALATQLLRLANSAFYGVSRGVGSVSFAVTVIGFSSVRSMAAVHASGLRGKSHVPEGFWRRAALHAAASSAVAPVIRFPVADAFAVGLLHNIGLGLIHAVDPPAHQKLLDEHGHDGAALRDAELTMFGMGHDAVGARALEVWSFPETFVTGVAHHHTPQATPSGVSQLILAGTAVAALVDSEQVDGDEPLAVFERLSIPEHRALELTETASDRAGEILASLS